MSDRVTKPYRAKQTGTFQVNAAADVVFALMCPVKEYDWVPGWQTKMVLSTCGLVEEDCMFITPSEAGDAIWITPAHDKAARRLTMYRMVPGHIITRLDIAVDAVDDGAITTVSYEHTALGESGRAVVDNHTGASYAQTMSSWRQEITDYLAKSKAA